MSGNTGFWILHVFAFLCGVFPLFITIPLHIIYRAVRGPEVYLAEGGGKGVLYYLGIVFVSILLFLIVVGLLITAFVPSGGAV